MAETRHAGGETTSRSAASAVTEGEAAQHLHLPDDWYSRATIL